MKKPVVFIFIVALILSFASCSSQTAYVDDESDDSPLQIYLLYWDDLVEDAVQKFNKKVARDEIDGRRIEITEFEYEQMDEMYNRISTEIMAGKGPDLVFMDYFFCSKNDFIKMASQNGFANMDILAKHSNTFNYDDYNDMIMDASVINETRSFMPISYYVPWIFSIDEAFKNSNIAIPDKLTYEKMLEVIGKFEKNIEMKYYMIFDEMLFHDVFVQNPSLSMDSDIFKEIQERSRDIYKENNNIAHYYDFFDEMIKGNSIFGSQHTHISGNQFTNLMIAYAWAKSLAEYNLLFWGLPCGKDGNSKAFINEGIAININSKHKNDAFKFVEYMMSYDFIIGQDNSDEQYSDISLPVNLKAYEDFKNSFFTAHFDSCGYNSENMITVRPLPCDLADRYIDIIESAQACEFNGQAIYIYTNIIRDTMHDYYCQRIDYESMLELLKSRTQIYYRE